MEGGRSAREAKNGLVLEIINFLAVAGQRQLCGKKVRLAEGRFGKTSV